MEDVIGVAISARIVMGYVTPTYDEDSSASLDKTYEEELKSSIQLLQSNFKKYFTRDKVEAYIAKLNSLEYSDDLQNATKGQLMSYMEAIKDFIAV